MGLMIYDGRDGPFELTLDSVQAYADTEELFTLDRYRWQKRVLLINAGDDDDVEFVLQARDNNASLDEFEARDMVLVRLLDSPNATAGQRALSSREVEAIRASQGLSANDFCVVLLGKDGGVKMKRSSVTPMHDIYALIDTMPMRRQEMRRADSGGDA